MILFIFYFYIHLQSDIKDLPPTYITVTTNFRRDSQAPRFYNSTEHTLRRAESCWRGIQAGGKILRMDNSAASSFQAQIDVDFAFAYMCWVQSEWPTVATPLAPPRRPHLLQRLMLINLYPDLPKTGLVLDSPNLQVASHSNANMDIGSGISELANSLGMNLSDWLGGDRKVLWWRIYKWRSKGEVRNRKWRKREFTAKWGKRAKSTIDVPSASKASNKLIKQIILSKL